MLDQNNYQNNKGTILRNYSNYEGALRGRILTSSRIIFRQMIAFPLIMLAFLPIIGITVIIGNQSQAVDEVSFFILLHVISLLSGILAGVLLSFRFVASDCSSPLSHRIILLAHPLIMMAAIAISYTISEEAAAKAALATNPIWVLSLLVVLAADISFVASYAILAVLAYLTTFLLFTSKCYHENPDQIQPLLARIGMSYKTSTLPKKLSRFYSVLIVCFVSVSLVFCSVYHYPNVEYMMLKRQFEMLNFSEEMDDFSFYTAFPYLEPHENALATLSEEPTLVFEDVYTSPRLDGATAFYPAYAAFVQATYKGFEQKSAQILDENQYGYYDYNLYLYPSYDGNRIYDILSCSKTSTAYSRLIDGSVDMIFAFEPSEEQLQEAEARGKKMVLTPIGYDAFCFFGSTENSVSDLTVEQIRSMYSGKIKNWRDVGGENKRIFAFTRLEGSGSQTIMQNAVMKDEKINSRYKATTVTTMGGMIRVIDSYLNTPNAIGYTFMYYSSSMVTSDKIRYFSVNGTAPTPENVRNGSYVFTQPFYAITLESNTDPNTKALRDWILSEQGQEIIQKTGYVTL